MNPNQTALKSDYSLGIHVCFHDGMCQKCFSIYAEGVRISRRHFQAKNNGRIKVNKSGLMQASLYQIQGLLKTILQFSRTYNGFMRNISFFTLKNLISQRLYIFRG